MFERLKRIGSAGLLATLLVSLALSVAASPILLSATQTPDPTATPTLDPNLPASYRVERVINANFPVALAFAPDGRLFYTEKSAGNVRVVNADGTLQPAPVIYLPTDDWFERGMLGIALDPAFEENHYVHVYHTEPAVPNVRDAANRVVRFVERDGVGSAPVELLRVPITTGAGNHNGGNLYFGPDGMLYVTIGEYANPAFSQDVNVMPGKIHRFQVTDDGLIPAEGNPFPGNSVYAYGLRNSFDFTFDPYSGQIFATENGPDCDDELNLITPGGNYGWRPNYPCDDAAPNPNLPITYPLLYLTPPEAPTGVTVYTGDAIPQWQGQLFFCMWNTGVMRRVVLNEIRDGVVHVERVSLQGFACQLDVTTGPDGALYFSDASGIYRIVANP